MSEYTDETLKPHKFIKYQTGKGEFDFMIICEWCGCLAVNGRFSDKREQEQDRAAKGCPCSGFVEHEETAKVNDYELQNS